MPEQDLPEPEFLQELDRQYDKMWQAHEQAETDIPTGDEVRKFGMQASLTVGLGGLALLGIGSQIETSPDPLTHINYAEPLKAMIEFGGYAATVLGTIGLIGFWAYGAWKKRQ